MEVASLCHTRPQPLFPVTNATGTMFPTSRQMFAAVVATKRRQVRLAAVVKTVSGEEEEEEWWWTVKCREKEEVVELLERLEREAIMGEDEGKKPKDYARRARIFEKSSRVFWGLKHLNNNNSPSDDL